MKTSPYHPFRSVAAQEEYLSLYHKSAQNWPIPSEEKMVDGSYGQTFVRISGPKTAPPLVLFPGAGTCSLMWSLNIKALAQNYRTYAVDTLINTGCVGKSVYTRLITNAAEAVEWLDELLNGLGLTTNINLLGASYGGWLASQYMLHHPGRLNKVVLVAPAGTVLPFRGAYLWRTIFLSFFPTRFTYRHFFRWSFPDLAQKHPQLLEGMIDEVVVSARCFEPPHYQTLPKLTVMSDVEWGRINIPTLVLLGEHEVLYSTTEAMNRLKKIAPHIQAEIISQAGHDLLLVQMEMVHQKVFAFLA